MNLSPDPIQAFHVIFCIDAIANTNVGCVEEVNFFQQKGLVLTAIKTHFVFPGVVEMMQLLFKMPDVRVSFFTSRHARDRYENRDELFVKELLVSALGEKTYLEVKKDVRILSAKEKKDSSYLIRIEDAISSAIPLENHAVINNQFSFIKPNQRGNYLHVPSGLDYRSISYSLSTYEDKNCDAYGNRKICFQNTDHFSCKTASSIDQDILNAKYIRLHFTPEKCVITFADLKQKRIKKLDVCSTFSSQTYSTNEGIYTLIEEENGKTAKINLKANNIYYVAGVLFKALKLARAGGTLSQFLAPIHFDRDENGSLQSLFDSEKAWHKREKYYRCGLIQLQQMNQNLTFLTKSIYKQCCKIPLDPDIIAAHEKLFQNREYLYWGCE